MVISKRAILPRWPGALLILVWVAMPGFAQSPPASPDEREITTTDQSVDVQPVAGDAEIATRIRDILVATGWFGRLSVAVDDGIVFLDGETATEPRAEWARDLASKTAGVVAVVNRIEVDPDVDFSLDPAISAVEDLGQRALVALPSIILAIIVLPLAWFASRLVRRLARWSLTGRMRSVFLADLLASLIALPVFLLGLYVVLQAAGLTQLAFSVVGGAGVLGIVIGFAFRDIAENFLASILLSVRQPFKRGDYISVAGQEGLVHSMNTRSTVLVSASGNHIQIPNASVFKSIIENFTAVPNRRDTIDLGIGYDAAISDAQAIITEILRDQDGIVMSPEPMVLANNFGVSTIDLKVYYWFDGASISPFKLKSRLIQRIKQGLGDAGISMPSDIHELVFPQGVPMIQPVDNTAAALEAPRTDATSAPSAPAVREEIAPAAQEDLANETEELEEQLATPIEGDKDSDLLAR